MSKQRQAPSKFSLFIIGSLMLAFLTTLIFLQTSNVWKDFSIQSTTDTLTLYALSTLNFVAFVIFSFILIRNIVKLARERKSFQLGAKIKTRLLLYFIGLSFLPILAMASFSYLFMNRAIERWISQIPENVVREAKIVQDSRQTEMALMLANLLEKQEVTGEMLTNLAKKGNLIFIQILSAKDEVLVHSEKPNDDFLQIELEQRLQTSNIISADFSDGRRLIIVPDLRPEAKFNQTKDESLREFDRLKDRQNVIRQMGLTTLGLLTLLLIFASSWVAFYIARGLTAPIKAIAEGANEIAQGNFSHRVDVLAEDELSLLVDAFNQMSGKLEENSTELKERRRYIETVLQSLSTGVISFDATDRVTTINKAAIRMLKLEDADFKHFVLSQLVGKENQTILEKLINRAKRIGQAAEQTVLIREHADGSTETGESLPVALTATALPDKNGVVLVIEDLTELITAQRASAWQEVARRMAHEIKNPLTPIQLSAERIAKRFDLETKRQSDEANKDQKPKIENQLEKVINESTSTIINEVASLKSMVDEFSRFARLPNVKLENGNLNNLIAQTVALYEDRGVKIKTNLAKNLPNVLFDEEQLKRVFVNLIENAIEAFDSLQTDKII
ncbi:MAG: HAMP domain-containing protein, partial [Pyrinomonadaceae bacterium]|nr:HAMP domain-containing protein [Pyrinomonadaceae bacterium]